MLFVTDCYIELSWVENWELNSTVDTVEFSMSMLVGTATDKPHDDDDDDDCYMSTVFSLMINDSSVD